MGTERLPTALRETLGYTAMMPSRIAWRQWRSAALAEEVFAHVFGQSDPAFWLDSAGGVGESSRFSFMGDASGPHAEVVTYDVDSGLLSIAHGDRVKTSRETVFAYLERRLRELRVAAAGLPFQFDLGYVGYLGYELKADCGAASAHQASTPDACLLFADRMLAFDRDDGTVYGLCLVGGPQDEAGAEEWLSGAEAVVGDLGRCRANGGEASRTSSVDVTPALRHDRDSYLDLIAECQRHILDGESYEICLTNTLSTEPLPDPLGTYLALRRLNPSPFAAFLHFGDVSVLSSSPERFLRIDADGAVEAKPVKGTIRRSARKDEDEELRRSLVESEKERAENLMIVDLLRNDLGTVCDIGTVHVAKLFDVESFATVHQLVSTIRGRLRDDASAIDCVRAAFPGGSMTGAPKLRTMEILDRLEGGARGVYSGAIGYFGLGGAADLSIVIRTIVNTPEVATVGVGGAITALSDPVAEFEETMVKAAAVVCALGVARAGGRPSGPEPGRSRRPCR
jgi:para-aminobenzoate synthetase